MLGFALNICFNKNSLHPFREKPKDMYVCMSDILTSKIIFKSPAFYLINVSLMGFSIVAHGGQYIKPTI